MGNQNKNNPDEMEKENEIEKKKKIINMIIYYDYSKKYSSIKKIETSSKINSHVYIICALINGFINIYSTVNNSLVLSFEAHKKLISTILQLKKNGFLLTCSEDNSFKIFKLSNNCNDEKLMYTIHLNEIYFQIYDIIEIIPDNNLIISVKNYLINFPIKKNLFNEYQKNLNDYNYSKLYHQCNFLKDLTQINESIFTAFCKNDLIFFKLNNTDISAEEIIIIKKIFLSRSIFNRNKICVLNKYNCFVLIDDCDLKIIDINYLEIVTIIQLDIFDNIKLDSDCFGCFYNNLINDEVIFSFNNKIYTYKVGIDDTFFDIEKNKNERVEQDYIEKIEYCPLLENTLIFYQDNRVIFFNLKSNNL